MTLMQMLMGAGPYYIVGFVITFFTLMGSRYLLGENIYPQEKFVRITFISIFWFASIVIATFVAYTKRGTRLMEAEEEKAELARRLEAAEDAAKANFNKQDEDDLQGPINFAQTDNPDAVERNTDVEYDSKEEKKEGFFKW